MATYQLVVLEGTEISGWWSRTDVIPYYHHTYGVQPVGTKVDPVISGESYYFPLWTRTVVTWRDTSSATHTYTDDLWLAFSDDHTPVSKATTTTLTHQGDNIYTIRRVIAGNSYFGTNRAYTAKVQLLILVKFTLDNTQGHATALFTIGETQYTVPAGESKTVDAELGSTVTVDVLSDDTDDYHFLNWQESAATTAIALAATGSGSIGQYTGDEFTITGDTTVRPNWTKKYPVTISAPTNTAVTYTLRGSTLTGTIPAGGVVTIKIWNGLSGRAYLELEAENHDLANFGGWTTDGGDSDRVGNPAIFELQDTTFISSPTDNITATQGTLVYGKYGDLVYDDIRSGIRTHVVRMAGTFSSADGATTTHSITWQIGEHSGTASGSSFDQSVSVSRQPSNPTGDLVYVDKRLTDREPFLIDVKCHCAAPSHTVDVTLYVDGERRYKLTTTGTFTHTLDLTKY